MSGGGNSTTTTQQTVPDWIKPYFSSALTQGQNLEQSAGPQYYPGQQVAPLNPLQEQGLSSIQNSASQPNASQGAQAANQFETSGALLNPSMNPYLQDTFKQAANGVQNQLSSEFAGSGRNIIGSAPMQSDEMNNLATQLYGGAYNTGLQNMTQASALAPGIDAGTYQPGQQLLNAGSGLQGQSQNIINSNMNAWNYNQQLPYNQLSWYSGMLNNNSSPFKSGSQTLPVNSNPWASAAGGAASGAALGSSFGPWGTAIGAVGGGLMGGLS